MKRATIGVLCLALSGCGQPVAKEEPPANPGFGRWMILPAGQHTRDSDLMSWAVWRLDTKTGDLEFCSHELIAPERRTPIETGSCQAPIKAHPSDSKILYWDQRRNRLSTTPSPS